MSARWAVFGVLLIAIGVAFVVAALVPQPTAALQERLAAALVPQPTAALQERQVETEAREHVEMGAPIVYRNRPPSSGPHYERTLRYGVFERAIEPGYWVHTLEHGGIVVLYRCDDPCPDLVGDLHKLYLSAPASARYHVAKLAAVPYAEMDPRLAAVAWGYILEMDAFDGTRILDFYREHLDRGPEDAL